MSKRDYRSLLPFAAAAFLLLYFLAFTWRGLFVYFVPDDMMNLYWAYTEPVWRLVATFLVPFTSAYRPTGAALYRSVYELAGFTPFAFRIAAYVFLCLNIWLLYALVRRLSGSPFAGLMAALIGAYHHRALDLYDENGTVYDVLCYTFYLATVLAYSRLREAPSPRRWIVFYLMCTAALNAKEMALTLPAILLAYEWIYRNRIGSAAFLLSAALAGASLAGKLGAGSKLMNNPAYEREITPARFFENSRFFLSDLFYLPTEALANWGVVLVLGTVIAVAIASHRRDLQLLAIWILMTQLPVLFIPRRSFFVMYLPLAGWAGYLGVLLVRGLDWATRVLPEPREPSLRAKIAMFLVTAACLAPLHALDKWAHWSEDRAIERFRDAVMAAAPNLPKPAKLLFLDDPFPEDDWLPTQILPLAYDDRQMAVDRRKRMEAPPTADELATYTAIFDWKDGRAIRVK